MNPFTTNAALQVLGLPRLCEAQFEALGRAHDDEAFLQGLIDLAFQARLREERRTRAMHAEKTPISPTFRVMEESSTFRDR